MANQRLPHLPRQDRTSTVERDGQRVSLYVDAASLRRLDPRQDRLRPVPQRGDARRTIAPATRSPPRSTAASATPRRSSSTRRASTGSWPPRATRTRRAASTATATTPPRASGCRPRRPSRATCRRSAPAATAPASRPRSASTPRCPDIVGSYADSIHGKGLTQSGLVVTATCVNCHSLARRAAAETTRTRRSTARTCANTCGTVPPRHRRRPSRRASTPPARPKDGAKLPVCEDCHTLALDPARTDARASATG